MISAVHCLLSGQLTAVFGNDGSRAYKERLSFNQLFSINSYTVKALIPIWKNIST